MANLRDQVLQSLDRVRAELANQRKLLEDFHRLQEAWKAGGFRGELLEGFSSSIRELENLEHILSGWLEAHPPEEPE